MFQHRLLFYGLMLLVVLTQSCGSAKYLKGDEYFLKKNEIVLKATEKIESKQSLKYELSTVYRQKVNGKFFFVPREWFWYKTIPDTSSNKKQKFRRWINRTIAEPPVIYNPEAAEQTADVMRRYLNDKGYYDAEVFFEDEQSKKGNAKVTYYVFPKKQLKIDTVTFSSEDSSVDSVLQLIKDRTLFKKGEGLDRELIQQEKDRIATYLKNHGYAKFSSNFFPKRLDADTTESPNKAHVYLTVNRPYSDSLHQIYRIGRVTVFPEYDIKIPRSAYKDTLIEDVHFRVLNDRFLVKPKAILKAIFLHQEEIYSQRNFDLTNRSLGNLSIYRFVRIEQEPDSLNPQILNFRIELTPNNLNEFGFDFELDYNNRSNNPGAGNLIGFNESPSLRNRNYLGGAEVFISNLNAGVEVNPNPENRASFWNTVDFGTQLDLYLPRFKDYFGFWRTLDKISIRRTDPDEFSSFYENMRDNASTRINANYNYVLLLNNYRYNLVGASYGYDYQRDQSRRYIINNLAIDYFNPTTQVGSAFEDLLDQNIFLERSFGDQLFVSMLFREFNYVYNGPTDRLGESRYFGFNLETAGAEIWAANSIYNGFASRADTFQVGNIDFSQYIRVEADFRRLRTYDSKKSLATRFSVGVARPFGFSSDVPYVKQFYVGGPNSIRTWQARSLGPGGFVDSLTLETNNPLLFYQAGDLRLEFNMEYRFNIFWRLNGAVFLDGGNIWTIREDPSRPESQFLFSSRSIIGQDGNRKIADPFYKQIALGTGFGLRFDFTYFIFRLDLGVPLKYPYRWKDDRFWVLPNEWVNDLNFNFGLGYPF